MLYALGVVGRRVKGPPAGSLRISELARRAAVSAQTIHYYLRSGLLLPPVKTARNMAHYGPQHIEDIRLIRELQAKRYLPLSVIKLILDAKREGKDPRDLEGMRLVDELFRPREPGDVEQRRRMADLVATSGLSASTVRALTRMGLLRPAAEKGTSHFDDLDVRVARAAKTLLDLGVPLADLRIYARYLVVVRAEAEIVSRAFRRQPKAARGNGGQIMRTLEDVKAALAAKVYRDAVERFQREEVRTKRP